MANDESGILLGIVEDLNTAIIDYQLSLQREMYEEILNLIVSTGIVSCNTPPNDQYLIGIRFVSHKFTNALTDDDAVS